MSKLIHRIESVRARADMVLEVRYVGGPTVQVDFAELPERFAVFAPLARRAVFKRARVADWGHTLEWPGVDGLDADRVLEMALEQQGRADTLAFRRWQDRHGLSLAAAAAAIGMTRRSVSQYRTGARPVPRTVLLALKGWEAEQRAG
ncbi:MAG: DUF2442 domain-containing protein [Burkholderiales bacterium]|nr:DUF2442 domain-containing protein [Burkholderiales bacterium]